MILKMLQAHHWNRKRAARALDISYRALLYKIRDAGLSSPPGADQDQDEPLAESVVAQPAPTEIPAVVT